MVYPALLPLMRTPRLSVVDWTDAPADLNGLVRLAERRNLVSARVSSHIKRSQRRILHAVLQHGNRSVRDCLDFTSPATNRQLQHYWHDGRHPSENVLGSGWSREAPLTEQGVHIKRLGWMAWVQLLLVGLEFIPPALHSYRLRRPLNLLSMKLYWLRYKRYTWTGSRGLTVGTTTISVHYLQSANPVIHSPTRSFLP